MSRPTIEEIAEARATVAKFFKEYDRYEGRMSDYQMRGNEIAAVRTLLAATEPPTDKRTGYCQICQAIGRIAEHQCFFGPVKP
jgi:hypothetical protein